jgi:hypothetical protein
MTTRQLLALISIAFAVILLQSELAFAPTL